MERQQGQLEFSARGVEILEQISKKMDKISGSSRAQEITALSTAYTALSGALNKVGHEAVAVGEHLLKVAAHAERVQATWTALLGSQSGMEKRMHELKDFAQTLPFQFGAINQAAITMQAFGQYSQRGLKAASDAAATFSKDIEDAVQAMMMAGEGNLRMLKMYGISSADIMKKIGKEGFRLAVEGEADLEKVLAATIEIFEEKFGGMSDKIMETLEGRWTNLMDLVHAAEKQFAKPLLDPAKSALADVTKMIKDMYDQGVFERIGQQLGGMLQKAMEMLTPFLKGGMLGMDVFAKAREKYPEKNLGLMNLMSEGVFTPTLSAIPEVRQAAGMALNYHESQFGKGSFMPDWSKTVPKEYLPYIQQAASMLLDGEDKEFVSAWMSSAIAQVALSAGNKIPKAKAGPFVGPPAPEKGSASPTEGLQYFYFGNKKYVSEEARDKAAKSYKEQVEALGGTPYIGSDSYQAALGGRPIGKAGHLQMGPPERGPTDEPRVKAERSVLDQILRMNMDTWDQLESRMQAHLDTTAEMFDRMGTTGRAAYSGLASGGVALMTSMTKLVELQLTRQGKAHMKLKDVLEATGRQVLVGFLERKAKEYGIEAAGYAALALGHAATGHWGLAADAAGAAIMYGSAAVLAGGTAAAVASAGAKHYAESTDHAYGGPYESANATEDTRTASATAVEAGVAPRTINYSVMVSYYGAVVFGDGGTREWYQSQLLPLIQESVTNGELR